MDVCLDFVICLFCDERGKWPGDLVWHSPVLLKRLLAIQFQETTVERGEALFDESFTWVNAPLAYEIL